MANRLRPDFNPDTVSDMDTVGQGRVKRPLSGCPVCTGRAVDPRNSGVIKRDEDQSGELAGTSSRHLISEGEPTPEENPIRLFSRYSLHEEFERLLRDARVRVRKRWDLYRELKDEEIAHAIFSEHEIYPLELLLDQQHIEERFAGVDRDTREPVFRYDCYVPYLGDDELWTCDPGGVLEHPEAEIFRRRLILVVRCCDVGQARGCFNRDLSKIREIIKVQTRQVAHLNVDFMAGIKTLVHAERRGDCRIFKGKTVH